MTAWAEAVDVSASGQMSFWLSAARTDAENLQTLGARYIPQFTWRTDLEGDSFVDADLAVNTFINLSNQETLRDYDTRLYRACLRYATSQSETRVGLQKINFGPARLLRPLRWFDQLNPEDPLQLTEGVYALRFRYNTLNNLGLWLWGLYGNDDPKGNETLPTTDENPEFGGRFQFPLLTGEGAVSLHTRRVKGESVGIDDFRESRIGLDGRWDIGVGLWFEALFQFQNSESRDNKWDTLVCVGGDYTFDIGNGLYVLGEHLVADVSAYPASGGAGGKEVQHTSAILFSYPIGVIDSVKATLYYDWEGKDWFRILDWQRQYDRWGLHLIGFWNDESSAGSQASLFSGKGVQVLLVFNY